MKELLEIIGNKKLISAFEKKEIETFKQIAFKLYEKARKVQDKKEYLISECVKYAQNETVDIKAALRKYQEVKCQEFALNARANLQCSAEFIKEKDPLKRHDMKETAYEEAYNTCSK